MTTNAGMVGFKRSKPSLLMTVWGWMLLRLWKCSKLLQRILTGQCELERIQRNSGNPADETLSVERCLTSSKWTTLKEAAKETRAETSVAEKHARAVALLKLKVSMKTPAEVCAFETRLACSVLLIARYNFLLNQTEQLRATVYDEGNQEHRSKLLFLWNSLIDEPFSEQQRYSRTWQQIGFQGKNPETDFRGMGYLSLLQLSFLAEQHTEKARQLVANGERPKTGYGFAVTGIHLTRHTLRLLRSGRLKWRLFGSEDSADWLLLFHRVYCWMFVEFDAAWTDAKPESIMQFEKVMKDFLQPLKQNPKLVHLL